jgi:cytochrome b subunit of formate dehydrogenase
MKGSPVSLRAMPDTCGTCHVAASFEFRRSVHGSAVGRGVLHAPTCTTCHGAHAIHASAAPHSPTSRLRAAGETCARCHGSVRITALHDLPVRVVEDFRGSYHGLAGARGDRRVANCGSCHGYHGIRPSSSPWSRTHPGNLARTCGECHPGASGLFARGGVHHTARTFGHRLVDLVGNMYAGMIGVVIGLMAVHNGLDFQRRLRDRRRGTETPAGGEYLRFTLNERVQHWLVAGSFVTLAVTGFALRLGWRFPGIEGEIQETLRGGVHRGAAILFGGLALYHVAYLVLSERGRRLARAILPRLRRAGDALCCVAACARLGPPALDDWHELLATVRYNVGLAPARPAYGRFTYWEKMEYWALVWGAFVMISTGLVLWFEVPALTRIPYWGFELFRTIHFYEATLAVLAIVVWHLYYVMINPDVFPLNRAMTRGTLTAAEMEREHPLEVREAQ